MKNATIPAQPTPTTNQTYSPSIPISLYREVMAELQTTQAHLNALKQENRELNQENQQLRQEIEHIISSVMHLQQVTGISHQGITATSMPPSISQPVSVASRNTPPESDRLPSATATNPMNANKSANSPSVAVPAPAIPFVSPFATGQPGGLSDHPEPLFTEQTEPSPRRVARSPKPSEIGGPWLFVCIFLIVVSAFGVGFFLIRPLMQPDQK